MPGSFSNTLETGILNRIFRGTTLTIPTTCYVGLYTTAPTDAGGGTEVTTAGGTGYQRVAVDMLGSVFGAATSGDPSTITNSVAAISFAQATASWGTVVAFGIFDAQTAGNLLVWADLTVSKPIASGDTATFPQSTLTITLE